MPQIATDALFEDLRRINKEVNKDIRYKTDRELYDRADYWTVIDGEGFGDCDDYALTKIKRLVKETNWKRENLSIAACYVEDSRGRPGEGEGHAVCVARTNIGDYVLDNRYPDVKAYHLLPYKWIMMEDYANKCWVKINS